MTPRIIFAALTLSLLGAAPVLAETPALPTDRSMAILGQHVSGLNGEDMGLVTDVLVDTDGKPRAAVIDFGGFLGVGTRKIAIDWQLIEFRPGDKKTPIRLGLDKAALQSAPEYKQGAEPRVVGALPPDLPAANPQPKPDEQK